MNEKAETLEEEIGDMIGGAPAAEEEAVEDVVEEAQETEEVVEESQEAIIEAQEESDEVGDDKEGDGEVVEEVVEEVAETVAEGEKEEEAEKVVEDVDELLALRNQVNVMAEAALKQGVRLDLASLGIEDVVEEGTAETTETAEVVPEVPTQVRGQGGLPNVEALETIAKMLDFSEVEDEGKFVAGMQAVLGAFEESLTQKYLTTLPSIVSNQVKQVSALQSAVDNFYEINSDLLPVRPTVGAIADSFASKHPNWTLDKVMEESAAATRKVLKMPKPSVESKRPKKVIKPSFAKPKGQSRPKPKTRVDKLRKEIDEIIDLE